MSVVSVALSRKQRAGLSPSHARQEQEAMTTRSFGEGPSLSRGSVVFSINFIRHESLPLPVRRLLVWAVLGYLALNAALFVAFTGTALFTHVQWRVLRHTLQGAAPSTEAVSGIGREMAMLKCHAKEDFVQLTAMVAQQRMRFPVAGKLAALTKTLPPRTWLTGLSGTRESRTITVQAAYLVDPDAPYALPTKEWMDALKADPSFGLGLKRLGLKSSSRKTQGSAELVVFELAAEWQPMETKK